MKQLLLCRRKTFGRLFLVSVLCFSMTVIVEKMEVESGSKGYKSEELFKQPCLVPHLDFNRFVFDERTNNNRSTEEWEEKYGITSSYVQLFRHLANLSYLHPLPKPKEFETCVVVGSSGILLNYSGLGKVIDSYDHVIRINFAPTERFLDFVGSKTSLDFGYINSINKATIRGQNITDRHILFEGTYPEEFEDLLYYLGENYTCKISRLCYEIGQIVYNGTSHNLKTSKLTVLTSYFRHWMQENLLENTKIRSTSGFGAVIFATHWCPTPVDIAGSGFISRNTTITYHYYDDWKKFKYKRHSPEEEHRKLREYIECGIIGKDLTNSIGQMV